MPSLTFLKIFKPEDFEPNLTQRAAHYTRMETNLERLDLKVEEIYDLMESSIEFPLSDLFPHLKVLSVTAHSDKEPWRLESGIQFRAKRSVMVPRAWQVDFRFSYSFNGKFASFSSEPPIDSERDEFMGWLKEHVAQLQWLQELDLCITVNIDTKRPRCAFTRLKKGRDLQSDHAEDTEKYELELRSAMAVVAATLVDALPTLRIGYFWEPYGFTVESKGYKPVGPSIEQWYRWRWSREPSENGSWEIKVSATPQNFNSDFTVNRDGSEFRYDFTPE